MTNYAVYEHFQTGEGFTHRHASKLIGSRQGYETLDEAKAVANKHFKEAQSSVHGQSRLLKVTVQGVDKRIFYERRA